MDDKNIRKIHDSEINSIDYDYNTNLFFGTLTLSNEELLIKKAVESSINGILITDLSGRVTYANPSFLKLWGYSDENEILGKLMIKFWKLKGVTMNLLDTIIDEGNWSGQLVAQKKDETEFHVRLSADLVRNRNHEPLAILATFIDISELVNAVDELENEKSMFNNIVEKSTDAILVVDSKGIVRFANSEVKKIFPKNETDSFVGEQFGLPVAENDAMELDILKNKDKPGVGEMRVSTTEWNNQKAYLVQIRDITKHKQIQKQLEEAKLLMKHTNIGLEEEVKKRTERIEMLLKQKDEFIGQLGHDLKTPISILLNIIPMIKENVENERVQEDCDLAIRNTKYIKNLVIQTLRLANLSSPNQSLDFKHISLQDIIVDAIESNKVIFDEKHIDIVNNVPNDLVVYADDLRLKEVFTNLFNNSVKFMQSGGVLTINAKVDEKFITISINDNGIGMNDDQINQIFNEFFKADESRHELDSSGLGLPICKRIVEKHGGTIWVESEGLGKGSTFYFTLPKKEN